MKKSVKTSLLIIMIVLSVFCKINCIYAARESVHTGLVDGAFTERINYCVNAVVFVILTSFASERIKSRKAGIACAFGFSVLFMLQLMGENFFLQYYEFNELFMWYKPAHYGLFVSRGLERYFSDGTPSYHTAFLVMTAVLILTWALTGYRDRIRRFFDIRLARRLYNKATSSANDSQRGLCAFALKKYGHLYSDYQKDRLLALSIDYARRCYSDELEEIQQAFEDSF